MKHANETIEQAKKTLEGLEQQIDALRTDLAKFTQEKNQLEQQCREGKILVEETKYVNGIFD